MSQGNWIPEIMYEEGNEGSSNIPFIMVPENEQIYYDLLLHWDRTSDIDMDINLNNDILHMNGNTMMINGLDTLTCDSMIIGLRP